MSLARCSAFNCLRWVYLRASVNADTFLAWVEHVLLPQLPPAAIILLDNAAFHRRADLQNTLRYVGHSVKYQKRAFARRRLLLITKVRRNRHDKRLLWFGKIVLRNGC